MFTARYLFTHTLTTFVVSPLSPILECWSKNRTSWESSTFYPVPTAPSAKRKSNLDNESIVYNSLYILYTWTNIQFVNWKTEIITGLKINITRLHLLIIISQNSLLRMVSLQLSPRHFLTSISALANFKLSIERCNSLEVSSGDS